MTSADDCENVAYYDRLASAYHLFFKNLDDNMREEGRWLDDIFRERRIQRVLDASCGTGRQAIPLAMLGYDVTAADPSEAMLGTARSEAARRGAGIQFIQASFADLPQRVNHDFDAVVAMGNSLCNLPLLEQIETALRAMRLCCLPGGIVVIGIKNFEAIRADDTRFHGHQVVSDPDTTLLFELWTRDDPTLVVAAFLLRRHSDTGQTPIWSMDYAETREYMLSRDELRRSALSAGFSSVGSLDHPSEAAYLLETRPDSRGLACTAPDGQPIR